MLVMPLYNVFLTLCSTLIASPARSIFLSLGPKTQPLLADAVETLPYLIATFDSHPLSSTAHKQFKLGQVWDRSTGGSWRGRLGGICRGKLGRAHVMGST